MWHSRTFQTTRGTASGLAALALLALSGSPLQAQDLSYTTTTKVEFGGAMGMMMKMVPDAETDTRQTVYEKGDRFRVDNGDTSTIFDLSQGRYTLLNHPDKTFSIVTVEEMEALAEQAREQVPLQNPMAQQGLPPEGAFEVRVSTDRTGRTRDINGHPAEQMLITMEMIPTTPEAEQTAAVMGTTVVFTEMWISKDFPGAEAYREAQMRMGEAFLEGTGADVWGSMGLAMMGASGTRESFEKGMEEMKDMEGVPVRTVTHMVTVPPGMEFDPDAVLAAEDQPLESPDMPSAAGMGEEAARGALGRRLGGLLGRRDQEEEGPAAPTVQTITMRSTSTIQDIKTMTLSDDLFQPPADYTERQPAWTGGD